MKSFSEVTLPVVHDPLMVVDPAWRVIQANDPAVRAFGARGLEGRLLWDVLPGGTGHPMAAALRRARAEGRDLVVEERGSDTGPGFAYRIYVEVDTITVLRTAIAERPSDVAPARDGNGARISDDFIAMVSHELRAPLNAMLGWAGLLRDGGLDPVMAQHAVDVIERNARVQADLITDLSDLSRLVAGRLPLARHPVDLVLLVRSAIDAVRPTAAAKDISVRTDTFPDLCPLEGDTDRLRQVIVNLLLNALKWTPAGGEVAITLLTAGKNAEMRVSDNGPGLPAELLPHIFDHAPSENGGARRRHGGLGLGLAIVRQLVEAHDGHVEALSPGPGLGTTIVVQLPCVDATFEAGLPPPDSLG